MRLLRRYPLAAALMGIVAAVVVVALPAVASSETTPVEAVNASEYTHYWSPAQQTVMAGEAVTFRNSTNIPHGVEWRSSLKPTCEEGAGKVPVGTSPAASGTQWSGKCTFTQPGTYTFWCTVHMASMSGTITVKGAGEPLASTEAATSVGETAATLEGTINPEGHKTSYYFKYGRTTSYEDGRTPTAELAATSANEVVSALLPGLTPGTTYHFQLVAENSSGTTNGADRTFTTLTPPGPPTASTGAATAVGQTEATLKGTANPDGRPTSYFFEWGTSTSYGNVTAEVPVGETHSAQPASATLSGLAAGTVYHFRLLAKNTSSETALGVDQTFTTASTPPSSPPPSTPPSPPPATTSSAPAPPPPPAPLIEPPPTPPILGSPSLAASQHGSSVHGSIEVSSSGAGGRLEIDLLAKSASLAKTQHSGSVRVGRLVRSSLSAGKVSFSVALTTAAKRVLTRKHHLPLIVKIAIAPTRGTSLSITRSVVLRS